MRTIRINRQKHITLLADHRIDPITKMLLKVGDEVVACAGCKTVFLADVWIGTLQGKCCVCEGTLTTDDIPNTENITFSKPISKPVNRNVPPPPVIKKTSYGGTAFLFALIAIGLGVYVLVIKHHVDEKQEENSGLNSRVESLSGQYNEVQNKVDGLQKDKNRLWSNYTELANIVTGISFLGGVRIEELNKYDTAYSTYEEQKDQVKFYVRQPILLKSLKVVAGASGSLRIMIYNASGEEKGQALNNGISEGVNTMRFNTTLTPGSYIMMVQGSSMPLLYLKNFTAYGSYPINSNNLFEITGPAYETYSSLYLYYFDWEFSLQPETEDLNPKR